MQVGGTRIGYAESVWSKNPETWRTRLEGELAVAAANLTSLTFDLDYYGE